MVETEAGTIRLEFVEWNEETSESPEARGAGGGEGSVAVGRAARAGADHGGELALGAGGDGGRPLPGISAWARRNQVILWDPGWWPMPPHAQHDPALAAVIRRTQVDGAAEARADAQPDVPASGQPEGGSTGPDPVLVPGGNGGGDCRREGAVAAAGVAVTVAGEAPRTWICCATGRSSRGRIRGSRTARRTTRSTSWTVGTGTRRCSEILDGMRVREGFPDAFRDVVGVSVESFATDFRRYLGWRGFLPSPPLSR